MAAQAIAKIAITTDPNIAFKSTAMSLVSPLLAICNGDVPLRQFEGLMALTNLASMQNQDVKNSIIQKGGVKTMEIMMFHDNFMIQRAATVWFRFTRRKLCAT